MINFITNQFVPLPKIFSHVLYDDCMSLGFITQIDKNSGVLKKFMVVDYQPTTDNDADLLCFSSETGKCEVWIVLIDNSGMDYNKHNKFPSKLLYHHRHILLYGDCSSVQVWIKNETQQNTFKVKNETHKNIEKKTSKYID